MYSSCKRPPLSGFHFGQKGDLVIWSSQSHPQSRHETTQRAGKGVQAQHKKNVSSCRQGMANGQTSTECIIHCFHHTHILPLCISVDAHLSTKRRSICFASQAGNKRSYLARYAGKTDAHPLPMLAIIREWHQLPKPDSHHGDLHAE